MLTDRVLKVLLAARGPLSARALQKLVSEDHDPTARNTRRAIRALKDSGHPVLSGAYGHLYIHEDERYSLTSRGKEAVGRG